MSTDLQAIQVQAFPPCVADKLNHDQRGGLQGQETFFMVINSPGELGPRWGRKENVRRKVTAKDQPLSINSGKNHLWQVLNVPKLKD